MTKTRSGRPPGIPTTYGYSAMRSRLEARWGAFFDLVKWSWTYEPFDAQDWIPDFLIQGPAPFLVEVGACYQLDDYRIKASKTLASDEHTTLVLGAVPFVAEPGWSQHPIAGLLTDDAWGSGLDLAHWARCRVCEQLGVYHESGSYQLRPCGHASGDRHLGSVPEPLLSQWWALAGNAVQWRASA